MLLHQLVGWEVSIICHKGKFVHCHICLPKQLGSNLSYPTISQAYLNFKFVAAQFGLMRNSTGVGFVLLLHSLSYAIDHKLYSR